MPHLLRLAVALRLNRMLAIALGLLLTLVGRTMAQPTLSIGPNTRVVGTGAVQLVYGGGALTNNGSLSLPAGQLTANGPTTYGGTGTATVATALFNHRSGNTILSSLLSVTDRATLSANTYLFASNGQLYLRTDQFPNANLVNDGYLNGTVQGLVTKATVTNGSTPYTSQLSTNVSGSVMKYQWQSSADNSQWSNVPGATSAMYTASVDATTFYRCLLTASNNCYYQFTPAVQLVVTATKPVAPTLPDLTATVGTPFSYVVPAFTGTAPISYGASGLPDGLVFDPATRTIAGTPNTVQTPTVTITATNIAGSTSGQFTITVSAPSLRVLHRDASNGQFNTNAIYPYFSLDNTGSAPIPYNELTVRYWLTVENPAPVTNLPVYGADFGAGNVQPVYVPLNPALTGATGYVEYSFKPAAGSLGAMSNSGAVATAISKQDYSTFNQADDYSYAFNRDFTPNLKFTAYRNGVLIWGTEPTLPGTGTTPLTVSATATTTVFPTTDNSTLVANAGGGNGVYTYSFSGPGTISQTGNTAVVSNQSAGVRTFTVTVTDTSTPTAQTATAMVSVTVTSPAPANTPPTTTANANQTATVGVAFSYTANAFTDAETPNNLTYGASINPANGLTYNPVTRVLAGTPTGVGVSSVTLTATDPGKLSTSTIFTVTVNPAPLALTLTASPTVILTTGTTTLSATVSGGTPGSPDRPYSYTFNGSGTIAATSNTATVSNLPAGVQTFTVVARDATTPTSQTISAMVSVTVTAPVMTPTTLRVLHRDASNGNLNTNAIYPYFSLDNTGSTAIPYSELTVRYYLTVENPAPVTNLPVYGADFGAGNVQPVFVPLNPARNGATGYVEYSFKPAAGSLAAMSNSGGVATAISKQDYSAFNQADDYSYARNGDFTPNPKFTAYRNGTLIWGTEPVSGARQSAETGTGLVLQVLGNPVSDRVSVSVTGAAGEPLTVTLSDVQGHLVGQRNLTAEESTQVVEFSVSQQPAGMLLLRASTPTQQQSVRVLKAR